MRNHEIQARLFVELKYMDRGDSRGSMIRLDMATADMGTPCQSSPELAIK